VTRRGRIIMRLLAGMGAIILVLALYLYYSMFIYRVVVANQSSVMLTNVQIIVPGGTLWTGELEPGESHTAYGSPGGEGDLVIVFDARGRTFRQGVDYVTEPLAENVNVTVFPDLKMGRDADRHYRLL
jgi:hypothetical protein